MSSVLDFGRCSEASFKGCRYRLARLQTGAALVELFVLSLVMIPLMFAIPMIGKLVDLRQNAVQASRYAAWEATVRTPGSAAPARMKSRFFGDGDAAIVSAQSDAGSNSLWGAQSDPALLAAVPGSWPAGTSVRIDETSVSALPYAAVENARSATLVGDAIESVGDLMGGISGKKLGLENDSLVSTGVHVDVQSNGWFDEFAGTCGVKAFACLEEVSVILTDGWSAGSDDQTKERVQALVPATVLEPVGEVVSFFGNFPLFEELKGTKDMFGYVDMGVLPTHADHGLDLYQEE